MSEKIGIVLIHGAGLNGTIWADFLTFLDHPCLVVEFPNRHNGLANRDLLLKDYVAHAKEQILSWEIEKIIIVGHSLGSCIGLALLESIREKVTGFVAIASIVPKSGHSFVQSMPFPQKLLMPIILKLAGTTPPKKVIEKELCEELSADQTDKIVNGFVAESAALYTNKISYSPLSVESVYIKLSQDRSMPIPLQEKMIANFNPTEIRILDSGHLPMISQPKKLAEIILQFVKKVKLTKQE